jgi:hypothetical protein
MGSINQGIIAPVTGKIGTVVGASWRGITYLRSTPAKRRHLSPAQQMQVAKFAVAVAFVKQFKEVINAGFAARPGKTPRNEAIAHILHHAIQGSYPSFTIDHNLALLTSGNLPNVLYATAVNNGNNTITCSWEDNTGKGSAKSNDVAVLIAYCPALQQVLYVCEGFTRNSKHAAMQAPAFTGHTIHTWLSFRKTDGSCYANSFYTGAIVLTQD